MVTRQRQYILYGFLSNRLCIVPEAEFPKNLESTEWEITTIQDQKVKSRIVQDEKETDYIRCQSTCIYASKISVLPCICFFKHKNHFSLPCFCSLWPQLPLFYINLYLYHTVEDCGFFSLFFFYSFRISAHKLHQLQF